MAALNLVISPLPFRALSSSPLVCASSRPSSLALAYIARRDRPSCRGFPAVAVCSLDKRLIGEPLPGDVHDEAIQSVQSMALTIALVKPERELVNITVQMLFAHVVVDTVKTTLHHSPNAFNAVCRDAIVNVLAFAVIDCLVFVVIPEPSVAAVFVGVQRRTHLHSVMDDGAKRVCSGIRHRHCDNLAVLFAHPQNGGFGFNAFPLDGMAVAVFATDIHLIHFHNTAQHVQLVAASLTEPLQHKPRALLGNADFLGELHGRDALARRDEQVHRVNPLVQRNVRPLEDRAGTDSEILFALVTAVVPASPRRDPVAHATHGAANAVRPQAPLKVGARRFLIGKHGEQFDGGNGRFAHGSGLAFWPSYARNRRGSQVYKSRIILRTTVRIVIGWSSQRRRPVAEA